MCALARVQPSNDMASISIRPAGLTSSRLPLYLRNIGIGPVWLKARASFDIGNVLSYMGPHDMGLAGASGCINANRGTTST